MMMPRKKISIAVPYKKRADNLRVMLRCIANQQDFDLCDLEIVIGAMEMGDEVLSVVSDFPELDISTIVSSRAFTIPAARNLAIRNCQGKVTLHVDADTALGPHALANLYDRHFRFGQNVCIVGQMIGYENNAGEDVESVAHPTYEAISDQLAELETREPMDARFTVAHLIPWAFTWTGLVAVSTDAARDAGLFFDEDFRGWGVDDLEWGFRANRCGLPIVLDPNVLSINLPHFRQNTANRKSEARNYRRFLEKWPCLEVELASAIGDLEANRKYGQVRQALAKIFNPEGSAQTIVMSQHGQRRIILGATRAFFEKLRAQCPADTELTLLPLVGLSLPFDAESADVAYLAPEINALPEQIARLIHAEASRIARDIRPLALFETAPLREVIAL